MKEEGRRKKDDGNRLKNDKPRLLHPSSFILHLSGKGGVLSRAWQTLDDVEERLLTPLTGSPALEQEVFLVQSRHLVCRDSKTGVERWRQPATWLPFWIAVYNNIVLAAGPDGVQAFALRDGRSAWEFQAPCNTGLSGRVLSEFQLAGSRFFCLQDQARLLALDVASGRVLWERWAPSARLEPSLPDGRFSPHYHADEERVLIQTAGRAWVLEAGTGRCLRTVDAGELHWPQPPLPLRKDCFCWVQGRDSVVLFDLSQGGSAWKHTLGGVTTLSGEPPLVLGQDGLLFLVIPRNHGYMVQRLDPHSGKSLWQEEVHFGPDRPSWANVLLGPERVCWTSGSTLSARAVKDGRLLWQQPLAEVSQDWCLAWLPPLLLTWPAAAWRTEVHCCWLTASVELSVTRPPLSWPADSFPVLVIDCESGQVCQRLNFVTAPRAQAQVEFGARLSLLPRAFIRRLPAAAEGPIVQPIPHGIVVAWGSRAWMSRRDTQFSAWSADKEADR
jgi:outer membrane protein assembly factor BamB